MGRRARGRGGRDPPRWRMRRICVAGVGTERVRDSDMGVAVASRRSGTDGRTETDTAPRARSLATCVRLLLAV